MCASLLSAGSSALLLTYSHTNCSHCGKMSLLSSCDTVIDADGDTVAGVCGDCLRDHYVTCDDCAEYVHEDVIKYVGSDSVCPSCLADNYSKCDDCGEYCKNDDRVGTASGSDICQSCYEDDYCTCEGCHDVISNDDVTTVNTGRRSSEMWCSRCVDHDAFTCADCDDVFADSISGGCNNHGSSVCESCSESYFCCESCNETYHTDSYGEDGRCESCATPECSSDHVHNYGYKPRAVFYGDGGGPGPANPGVRYAGVELETIVKSDADYSDTASEVSDRLGEFAYMKEDSSLGSRGIEIVTHPATLEGHRKLWKAFHDDIPALSSWAHSCCGLHIHISRDGLTNLQISKIVCFVNREENKSFVVKLAGRESSYASLKKNKKMGCACRSGTDRREAVNLCNSKTIEFRIFKGNLRPYWLFRSLEFCFAIAEFCSTASRSINDSLDYVKFCEFVSKEKKRFPELARFCSEFQASV